MKSALGIVISREYLERVKRKSFIISTIFVPLLMVALMVAPALFMVLSEPESKVIAVIDDSGVIAPRLHGDKDMRFTVTGDEPVDSARANSAYDAILVIGPNVVAKPSESITLYSHGSLTLISESAIRDQITDAIEDVRLQDYNINNLRQILDEVKVDLSLNVIDMDKGDESATSSVVSYVLALAMDMMLYMFILIYGQMVMNSIIEEKSNRVLELVVSSVKPMQLMMGKIVGVGLVALTQILIWAVIVGACSAWLVPFVGGSSVADDPDVAIILSQLGNAGYFINLFVFMLLFFIGGYLLYSSMFAAIGSAVDNIQDASQLTTIATMPIIIGIVVSMSAIQNPSSTFAVWLSIIPFTSPMTMMVRLPFGVPAWELAVSLLALYATIILFIWICAKIYRVGIFLYGKKPSVTEIIRWVRYK